jgi:hypothetical protein
MPKNVTNSMTSGGGSSAWPVVVFALIALGAGLSAMAALPGAVTAATITALITAVLGVVWNPRWAYRRPEARHQAISHASVTGRD